MSETPKPVLEVEPISGLRNWQQRWIPPEDVRLTRGIGDTVRLMVLVNGQEHYPIWVRIVEVDRPRYVGVFEAVADFGGPIPNGTRFEFTADHIIDY